MRLFPRTVRRKILIFVSMGAVLVAGAALRPTNAHAATACTAYAAIDMGKYWLNNNLWGRNSGSGTQCVTNGTQSGNTISWRTNYNWSGQSNSVKSYTSSVLGWHWGNRRSGTGLPVRISDNRNVNTGWNFSVQHTGGAMNVAYDLWLHTISNPTYANNPTDEIMVWLHRQGGAGPVGTRQATVNIGGTNWDLYRGNIGWNVFSFIRTSNTGNATLNLRDFLNNLVSRGWVQNSKYLTSVQAGTEVFVGSGQVITNSYYANVG
ncbi:MAG TPA: hypothetical protein VES42_10255 [Pilimelia sp.]|nr:hypothetical protein [Pilimelia sp.]